MDQFHSNSRQVEVNLRNELINLILDAEIIEKNLELIQGDVQKSRKMVNQVSAKREKERLEWLIGK